MIGCVSFESQLLFKKESLLGNSGKKGILSRSSNSDSWNRCNPTCKEVDLSLRQSAEEVSEARRVNGNGTMSRNVVINVYRNPVEPEEDPPTWCCMPQVSGMAVSVCLIIGFELGTLAAVNVLPDLDR